MRHGRIVATREDRRGLIRTRAVLQSHPDAGTRFAGGASADRIHNHQNRAVSRRENAIDIGGSAGFFHAVAREITSAFFQREMDIKVMGYIRCAREVAPHMRTQGWGRIINISGLAARQTGNTVGSMRNVAVAAMTKNLADELGPAGINVTVVHPGLTRTERTASLVQAQAKTQGVTEQAIEQRMADMNSIRHLLDASEVAQVVAFLASPKSIAINGETIAAGGGALRSIHY